MNNLTFGDNQLGYYDQAREALVPFLLGKDHLVFTPIVPSRVSPILISWNDNTPFSYGSLLYGMAVAAAVNTGVVMA